jgi:hypothetical protein
MMIACLPVLYIKVGRPGGRSEFHIYKQRINPYISEHS